jgi:hypothetical protein
MKKLLFFNCILLVFSSCKKKNEQYLLNSIGTIRMICPKIKDELKEIPVVNISLSTYRPNDVDLPQSNITAFANMQSTNATDSLIVNGITIPNKKSLHGVAWFSTNLDKPQYDNRNRKDLDALFGQDVFVYFNSDELGSISGTLRSSEPIRLKVNDSEKTIDSLRLSKDLKITWNKDSLNKNPIYLSLIEQKLPDFSSKSNQLDTANTVIQIYKHVDDNGIFYIKSSELQIFHDSFPYVLTLRIMRGSYSILNTSKGKKALFSSTSESLFYLNQMK